MNRLFLGPIPLADLCKQGVAPLIHVPVTQYPVLGYAWIYTETRGFGCASCISNVVPWILGSWFFGVRFNRIRPDSDAHWHL